VSAFAVAPEQAGAHAEFPLFAKSALAWIPAFAHCCPE
jgi:hypothetical protein